MRGLQDGTFDAIMPPKMRLSGRGSPRQLLRERGANVCSIDGPPVERLRRESPFVPASP